LQKPTLVFCLYKVAGNGQSGYATERARPRASVGPRPWWWTRRGTIEVKHRAHHPRHRQSPHRVVAHVGHQYIPVLILRQARWVPQAFVRTLQALLSVAGQRAHRDAGHNDPDGVVVGVRHHDLVVGRQFHGLRLVEARGIAPPVCESFADGKGDYGSEPVEAESPVAMMILLLLFLQ